MCDYFVEQQDGGDGGGGDGGTGGGEWGKAGQGEGRLGVEEIGERS